MSSSEFLEGSYWRCSGDVTAWHLQTDKTLIAVLHKDREKWYGLVLPNVKDHLGPHESLNDAMFSVIKFIKRREGE